MFYGQSHMASDEALTSDPRGDLCRQSRGTHNEVCVGGVFFSQHLLHQRRLQGSRRVLPPT